MRTTLGLLGVVLLAACNGNTDTAPAGSSAGAPSGGSIYEAALAHAERSEADRARDEGRKPAEVLAFFAIEPGMRVLDLYSGGGYYSEILARLVGPSGSVNAHNNEAYLGFAGDEIKARYADGRLENVQRLMAENNELELDEASFDAITMILTYHDFYFEDANNGWPKIDAPAFLAELHGGLKPGGIVGLVDHRAPDGAPTTTGGTTHRIDPAIVIADMQAAGFVLEDETDLLRNPDDDLERNVFDPAVRGATDRFVLRFRKPE